MKPILFNTEMVKAILEGRKTQTRRLIKPRFREDEAGWQVIRSSDISAKPLYCEYYDEYEDPTRPLNPPYKQGDILYVRENFAVVDHEEQDGSVCRFVEYDADYPYIVSWNWKPSIHMPKEYARIFLQVDFVKIERMKEITASDVMSEGFTDWNDFVQGWNSTVKQKDLARYGWDANPWVWVISFKRITKDRVFRFANQQADQDVFLPAT